MKFIKFVKTGLVIVGLIFFATLQSKADDEVLVSENGSAYFETDKYQISIILLAADDVDSVIEQFDKSPNYLKKMVITKFTNTVKLNEIIYVFITLIPLVNEKNAQLSYDARTQSAAGDTTETIKEIFLQGNLVKGRMYRIIEASMTGMGADEPTDVGIARMFINVFDHKKKIKSVEMLINVIN